MLLIAVSAGFAADPPAPEATTTTTTTTPAPEAPKIDSGDTAWMLMATGLVMLMVPGLALFYGGLVRQKNLLGTMMQSMVALGLIGIQWVLVGYALAFGDSHGGYIGWSHDLLGLQGISTTKLFPNTHIPIFVHCMYQGMFAIITPALISGAIAERIRFGPYCLFILLWSTLVYDPLAHWVWAVDANGQPAGWLGKMGALDFAGGTVVHVAAGVSALAAILALRKRIGYPEHAIHPNSVVLSLVGAGLLWFGWFGFNGGSGLSSGGLAAGALGATQVAAAAAALTWILVEWAHRGKPTGLGFATGLVAGLVAVTPASGYVTPMGALCIGVAAGVICYLAVCFKPMLRYDDSLDAFGVHGVGGALGAILTGVFVSAALYKDGAGLKPEDTVGALGADGTNWIAQVSVQATAVAVAALFSFVVSFVLVKIIDLLFGFCSEPQAESIGLDRYEHGEVGFDFGLAGEGNPEVSTTEPRPATAPPVGLRRFTVVVDGPTGTELRRVWSDLCQANGSTPPTEMKSIYPFMTTIQGNRFRFSGGDPSVMTGQLEKLLSERLSGQKVKAHVEA